MHLKPDSETNASNQQHGNNNGNAIVRVESAADEGLDELFKAVMSPNDGQSRLPQQVPMRQRRLPPSFFRPPSAASSSNSVASASHSRESSLDGGYQSGQTPVTGQPTNNTNNVPNKITTPPVLSYSAANGMAIIHPRANSSPAALQPANGSLSAANVNGQAFNSNELKQANESTSGSTTNNTGSTNISHFRQMSYDLEQIRLPDGWEMSYTANGERYFLNHKEKTTTWEDPRKKMIEEMLHRNGIQPIIQPTTTTQASVVPQPPSNNQPPPTSTPATSGLVVPEPEHLSYVDPSIVPLPEGWEQAQTSSGDIYFISHIDQTTTWFHPSIPRNLQMKRVQQQSCTIQLPPFQTNNNQQGNQSANIPSELVAALKNMNTSCQTAPSPVASATIVTAATNPLDIALKSQQNQHLRDLELERERMKQRQEELLQSSLLNGTASNILLSSSTEPTPSPFMMQQQQNECHSRQESIDSGLDLGNSSNYSMPHTPDDFLRSLTLNTANNNNVNSATSSNLTNSSTNSANANSNSNNNSNNNVATISDDLAFEAMQISGLDLDSESMDFMQGLDMDLLSNVEELLNSNKDNIMTWL